MKKSPNEIQINIEKSEIPIVWIDTSIINLMTQWKFNIGTIDSIQKDRISKLYKLIYEAVRKGRLICPLAEQEGEVWVHRNKWLDTIHSLSLGIETEALYSIQHKQIRQFMKAYVENKDAVSMRYADAFHSDPADELRDILRNPFYVSTRHQILFGEEYQKKIKQNIYDAMELERKKNVISNVTFEKQLEQEYIGELQALFILQKRFLYNECKDDDDLLNTTSGMIDLNHRLLHWKSISGKKNDYNGLLEYYKSIYHKTMPYTHISCNLFAKLMTDKQPIRSGDVMDIKHASTLLPYSDLYITDRAMSAFIKSRKFDSQYNTIVCYIGDTDVIEHFISTL